MYLKKYIAQCEAFGWSGGPEFQTRIVQMANGRERRNADWGQHRHRYTLPFQNIRPDGYATVRQMFEVVRGQLGEFLYYDPLSRLATDQLFGVGDGVTTEYQLSTLSVLDGVTYQREVYALYTPDDGGDAIEVTPTIAISGVPTVAFVTDPDRGKVIFTVAPANGAPLRWSGPFSVWVRFLNDWLPFSIDNRSGEGFTINGTIDLMELPPPAEITSNG